MSVSLFLTGPLYSFSQTVHTEESHTVRKLPPSLLLCFSAAVLKKRCLTERKIKITAEYETCCVRFISSWDSVSPSSSSYLPEKESQQAQQQQAEQDGQNDDPPRHSSVGGFTSLWEHSQPHLEEHEHSDRTSARTFMSRRAINILHCHTCTTCV